MLAMGLSIGGPSWRSWRPWRFNSFYGTLPFSWYPPVIGPHLLAASARSLLRVLLGPRAVTFQPDA